jgi:peptidyl-prolyl cis-trans isomerase SurA
LTLLAAVALFASAPGRGQTVDRVVASVGNTAITSSDVENEFRLELFLDGKPVADSDPDVATLNQVRDRLIDRVLLDEEAQASEIKVAPDDPAVDQRLDEVRKKFSNPAAYQNGLKALGMTEAGLRQDLAEQQTILQLIDRRLRPEAAVEPSEIEAYYRNTLVPELARQRQPAPPLAEGTDRIREILVQQKIGGLLEDWLKRLRAARDVRTYGSPEAEGNQQKGPQG